MTTKVLSHVILGSNNVAVATEFYDKVLGVLGHERRWQADTGAGYGKGDGQGIDTFWITKPLNGEPASVGNGTNVCFVAPSRQTVREFYRIALKSGGADQGPPGIREEVHGDFYACYIIDPDGNKIVAACHEPE